MASPIAVFLGLQECQYWSFKLWINIIIKLLICLNLIARLFDGNWTDVLNLIGGRG